jgi:hypothetical protein
MIEWYISERQEGKTEHLIEWVKQGNKVNFYPGWDRVILVASLQEADRLRGGDPATNKYGLEYHQVYALDEWVTRYPGSVLGPVQIGVDNVEHFLNRTLFGTYGRVAKITATGKVLEVPRHV